MTESDDRKFNWKFYIQNIGNIATLNCKQENMILLQKIGHYMTNLIHISETLKNKHTGAIRIDLDHTMDSRINLLHIHSTLADKCQNRVVY
jgi:hypothetical protein